MNLNQALVALSNYDGMGDPYAWREVLRRKQNWLVADVVGVLS
jgi:hypothetical protein